VNSFKPDIIHSHLLGAEYIAMHLKTPNSTKFFNHIHGNRPELKKISIKNISKNSIIHWWEKNVYRKLLKQKSVKHIAISNECYRFYNKIVGVNKKNIIYLPNCINYNHFKAYPKTINSKKSLSLITIGRLIPSKGHDFLLNVLKIILSKNVRSNLTIIGDGPEKDNLLNKAKKLKISENINFIGITMHPETFLKDADLYLHSSYYEPFGLVILEAMASGLPVICTDGKGNRELIKDGINGYMLEERNANEFANKIMTLIKSEELYNSQSKNAIKFSSDFDISDYIKKLIDIYVKELN
jgi:glycosyltransferase involved in cell wall biosynthesis